MDGTLNVILLLLIDNNAELDGVVLAYVILVQGVNKATVGDVNDS